MEMIDEICRLCLFVNPDTLENLFENEIWDRITLTINVDIEQHAYLPKGICVTCKAIIYHIYNFHQKVVQSQNVLKTKFEEGINSLQNFYSSLKSIKKEHIDDSCINIAHEIKTDEDIDHLNLDKVKYDKSLVNIVESTNETVFQKHKRNINVNNKKKTAAKRNKLKKKNEKIETELRIIKKEDYAETKNENIDEDIDHLSFDEVKYDRSEVNIIECTNETPKRNLRTANKTTVKCKVLKKKATEYKGTNIEILLEAEDCVEPKNENSTVTDTYCEIKEENSDYDDFATISHSDDDDWSPESKSQKTAKKRVIHNFTGDVNGKTNGNRKKKKVNDTKDEYDEKIIVNRDNSNEQSKKSEEDNAAYIWKCLTCFEILPNRKLLVSHFKSKHKPEVKVSSDIDLKNFTTVVIDDKTLYKCGYCDKLKTKKDIKRHIVVHDKLRPYVCNMCGRTFKLLPEIILHNRVHDNSRRVFCSHKCGYSSMYLHSVKEHERSTHRGEFKYKCECGKGFNVKTWYLDHQNEHTGLRPYACTVCQQNFQYKKYLTHHINSVHSKNNETTTEECRFVCTLCSHPCENKIKLRDHLAKEHGMETKYLCDLCGKSCTSSSHLSQHRRIHGDERPFVCSKCDKSFKQRNKLTRHMRTHSDPRPHGCPNCAKRYAAPAGLRHHIATECDKSFKQRCKLTRHMRTHSDPRPHGCPHCAKLYARPVGLRHHIATCHGKKEQQRKIRKRRRDSNSSCSS